ncbi:amidohydrolase family protein [Pseudonocardia sp. K10HN5]|uniref:Amidohydrolase family protein n=1 Tax=Pseudonocardia acidicola TaxID=2724939 RepID=A0ABX1SGC5_9PSEU|nr:amidohydrolase family protein [Pseudonocardia acidicola]
MDTLISADRLLTGPAGQQLTDAAVLVRGDRIVAVGGRDELRQQARAGSDEQHHSDATLLPGLINTHLHLVADASRDPFGAFRTSTPEAVFEAMADRALQALDAGVTTIRDLGDGHGLAFALRNEIASGTRPGPRILAAGTPLTPPDGHCWFLGGVVEGPDAIRARIRELADAGADVIKVMAGGGQTTPGGASPWESQFTLDELRLIVAEAGAVGLPVAAHAHGTQTITDCVAAGVRTIEHCGWRGGSGKPDRRDDVARRMAAAGIYAGDTTPPNWPAFAARIPFPPGHRLGDQLPWMDSLGVPIIIGTDSGMPGAVFNDFVSALEMYTELGFPNDRILQFATANAADALGLSAVTGCLAAGLAADLLVVDGDPLTDLQTLRRPRLVMARGRIHHSSAQQSEEETTADV